MNVYVCCCVLYRKQNFFPFEGGMVVGQLIFTAAMLSAILLVSANLYLVKASSNSAEVKEEEQQQEEEEAVVAHSELQPWHQFGGLFYKSSRSGMISDTYM